MKAGQTKYWVIGVVALTAACIGLYFVHPYAPLVLLLSLLIQAPLVWVITHGRLNRGYQERAEQRRKDYEMDGDAEKWLRGEEAEANSVGYRYWSPNSRMKSVLNRAEPLLALGRGREAAQLLAEVEPARLDGPSVARYEELMCVLRSGCPASPQKPALGKGNEQEKPVI